jgi:hypothetical protein
MVIPSSHGVFLTPTDGFNETHIDGDGFGGFVILVWLREGFCAIIPLACINGFVTPNIRLTMGFVGFDMKRKDNFGSGSLNV